MPTLCHALKQSGELKQVMHARVSGVLIQPVPQGAIIPFVEFRIGRFFKNLDDFF